MNNLIEFIFEQVKTKISCIFLSIFTAFFALRTLLLLFLGVVDTYTVDVHIFQWKMIRIP